MYALWAFGALLGAMKIKLTRRIKKRLNRIEWILGNKELFFFFYFLFLELNGKRCFSYGKQIIYKSIPPPQPRMGQVLNGHNFYIYPGINVFGIYYHWPVIFSFKEKKMFSIFLSLNGKTLKTW